MILFDTRCLLHTTCSLEVCLNEKRTVLLFALPKLTDWVGYTKWPGRIKQSKEINFLFPFLTDRKWINKTRRQKYVRIRFHGEALKVIRLSNITFAKYYNLTLTLDLVHGIRNQVLAVYLAKREPLSRVLLWKFSAIEAAGGYSLEWPIRGGSAPKGYLFHASGTWKRKNFTGRSNWKGK